MKVHFAVVPVFLSALGLLMVPSPVHAQWEACESQEDAVEACMNAAGVTAIADVFACEGCIDQLADAAGEETDQDSCTAADTAACSALPDCPCAGCDEEATALLQCKIDEERTNYSSPCVATSCESPGSPPAAAPAPSAAPLPSAAGPPALGGGALLAVVWATCAYAAVFIDAGL